MQPVTVLFRKFPEGAFPADGLVQLQDKVIDGDIADLQVTADRFPPICIVFAAFQPDLADFRFFDPQQLRPGGGRLLDIRYNEAHSNTDAGYFELSKVYGVGAEQEHLAIFLDGSLEKDVLNHVDVPGDFYALKGILETWLKKLGYTGGRIQFHTNKTNTEQFHPFRSAEIWVDRQLLGIFGDLHPDVRKEYDLKQGVYAELVLDVLLKGKGSRVKFEALERYPAVNRDIALVVSGPTTAQSILDVIRKAGRKLVRQSEVFDVYEGEHVGEGQKSIALRITYQAKDHTLTDEEVTTVHQEILDQLKQQLNAELRA